MNKCEWCGKEIDKPGCCDECLVVLIEDGEI